MKNGTKLAAFIAVIIFVIGAAFLISQPNLLTQVLLPVSPISITVNEKEASYIIQDEQDKFMYVTVDVSVIDFGDLPDLIEVRISYGGNYYYGCAVESTSQEITCIDDKQGMLISVPTADSAAFLSVLNVYDETSNELVKEVFFDFKINILLPEEVISTFESSPTIIEGEEELHRFLLQNYEVDISKESLRRFYLNLGDLLIITSPQYDENGEFLFDMTAGLFQWAEFKTLLNESLGLLLEDFSFAEEIIITSFANDADLIILGEEEFHIPLAIYQNIANSINEAFGTSFETAEIESHMVTNFMSLDSGNYYNIGGLYKELERFFSVTPSDKTSILEKVHELYSFLGVEVPSRFDSRIIILNVYLVDTYDAPVDMNLLEVFHLRQREVIELIGGVFHLRDFIPVFEFYHPPLEDYSPVIDSLTAVYDVAEVSLSTHQQAAEEINVAYGTELTAKEMGSFFYHDRDLLYLGTEGYYQIEALIKEIALYVPINVEMRANISNYIFELFGIRFIAPEETPSEVSLVVEVPTEIIEFPEKLPTEEVFDEIIDEAVISTFDDSTIVFEDPEVDRVADATDILTSSFAENIDVVEIAENLAISFDLPLEAMLSTVKQITDGVIAALLDPAVVSSLIGPAGVAGKDGSDVISKEFDPERISTLELIVDQLSQDLSKELVAVETTASEELNLLNAEIDRIKENISTGFVSSAPELSESMIALSDLLAIEGNYDTLIDLLNPSTVNMINSIPEIINQIEFIESIELVTLTDEEILEEEILKKEILEKEIVEILEREIDLIRKTIITDQVLLAELRGLHCWDLDGDGIKDPEEDINGDGSWSALDCRGEKGDKGDKGDQGNQGDPGTCSRELCTEPGPAGAVGPIGPIGPIGPRGPVGPPGKAAEPVTINTPAPLPVVTRGAAPVASESNPSCDINFNDLNGLTESQLRDLYFVVCILDLIRGTTHANGTRTVSPFGKVVRADVAAIIARYREGSDANIAALAQQLDPAFPDINSNVWFWDDFQVGNFYQQITGVDGIRAEAESIAGILQIIRLLGTIVGGDYKSINSLIQEGLAQGLSWFQAPYEAFEKTVGRPPVVVPGLKTLNYALLVPYIQSYPGMDRIDFFTLLRAFYSGVNPELEDRLERDYKAPTT